MSPPTRGSAEPFDDSTGYPTSEEMHYAYDGAGRVLQAAFAQTPASGFTPGTGASYYDSSHLASSRARAYYVRCLRPLPSRDLEKVRSRGGGGWSKRAAIRLHPLTSGSLTPQEGSGAEAWRAWASRDPYLSAAASLRE